MGVGCKNASVAMAVSVMLMLMHICVEEVVAAASVEEEMELNSFFSPPKSMAVGLGEQLVMAYDQGDEEFVEEITRRMLAGSGYIGNNALDKNKTPCSNSGISYYNSNCNNGNPGGPYTKSCTVLTKCARGT